MFEPEHHLGRHAVPLLDDLEFDKLGRLLQRLALDPDRFGICLGLMLMIRVSATERVSAERRSRRLRLRSRTGIKRRRCPRSDEQRDECSLGRTGQQDPVDLAQGLQFPQPRALPQRDLLPPWRSRPLPRGATCYPHVNLNGQILMSHQGYHDQDLPPKMRRRRREGPNGDGIRALPRKAWVGVGFR